MYHSNNESRSCCFMTQSKILHGIGSLIALQFHWSIASRHGRIAFNNTSWGEKEERERREKGEERVNKNYKED